MGYQVCQPEREASLGFGHKAKLKASSQTAGPELGQAVSSDLTSLAVVAIAEVAAWTPDLRSA